MALPSGPRLDARGPARAVGDPHRAARRALDVERQRAAEVQRGRAALADHELGRAAPLGARVRHPEPPQEQARHLVVDPRGPRLEPPRPAPEQLLRAPAPAGRRSRAPTPGARAPPLLRVEALLVDGARRLAALVAPLQPGQDRRLARHARAVAAVASPRGLRPEPHLPALREHVVRDEQRRARIRHRAPAAREARRVLALAERTIRIAADPALQIDRVPRDLLPALVHERRDEPVRVAPRRVAGVDPHAPQVVTSTASISAGTLITRSRSRLDVVGEISSSAGSALPSGGALDGSRARTPSPRAAPSRSATAGSAPCAARRRGRGTPPSPGAPATAAAPRGKRGGAGARGPPARARFAGAVTDPRCGAAPGRPPRPGARSCRR